MYLPLAEWINLAFVKTVFPQGESEGVRSAHANASAASAAMLTKAQPGTPEHPRLARICQAGCRTAVP
jgi:hypothetical protein